MRLGLQVKEPHQPNQIPRAVGILAGNPGVIVSQKGTKDDPHGSIVDKKEDSVLFQKEKENLSEKIKSGPSKATGTFFHNPCRIDCLQPCGKLWEKFKLI